MSGPTRVAVIGAGALGEHHARIYARLPEAELLAVVDVREERARRVAEECGCPAYSDYHPVLDRVEAVSLAVPTVSHASIGNPILRRGIHLLVEKPMAHSLPAAEELLEAQAASGCILHVGHSERFNPALEAVRPLIDSPRFFEAHRLGTFVPRSLDVDVVLDLMIHDLDLILHLVSRPLREIRAVGIPVLTPRVDIANVRLEFDDGCVANLTASRVSRERIRKLRLFQPHDYISLDLHRQEVEVYSLVQEGPVPRIQERRLEVQRDQPLKLEIEAFLRAVRSRDAKAEPRSCPGEEGKKALGLALEIVAGIVG